MISKSPAYSHRSKKTHSSLVVVKSKSPAYSHRSKRTHSSLVVVKSKSPAYSHRSKRTHSSLVVVESKSPAYSHRSKRTHSSLVVVKSKSPAYSHRSKRTHSSLVVVKSKSPAYSHRSKRTHSSLVVVKSKSPAYSHRSKRTHSSLVVVKSKSPAYSHRSKRTHSSLVVVKSKSPAYSHRSKRTHSSLVVVKSKSPAYSHRSKRTHSSLVVVKSKSPAYSHRSKRTHSSLVLVKSKSRSIGERGIGCFEVRTDWFIFALLRSLPWIASELNEKKKEELDNLLAGVDQYMQQRDRKHAQLLQVWTDSSNHEQEEYLDCIHAQIKQLASSDWQEKHITRLYVAFDSVLADALQHNLPTLTPPSHQPSSVYPQPWVIFRLFDYTDCPEDGPILPGVHSIERFLVEDELGWIIDLNELNRKDCAEALFNYTHKAQVPLAYVILETIFARMFQLPQSPQPRLFYGSLLIELCRIQPNVMPQVLAQAAELLYERVEKMQPECIDRFVDWFSYHLSNFQYRWAWQDWKDSLQADELNPKFRFAREVLEKCMRFSFYERVLEFLPATHARLRPLKPEIDCPFDDEANSEYEQARHFQELFHSKLAAEDMIAELRMESQENDVEKDAEGLEFSPESLALFFAVLLKLACKSFSHNFAALTRYHRTLKVVTSNSEEMQLVILQTLYRCWRSNHQILLVLLDKLLKMQIIDVGLVIQWIFENVKEEHGRQWVWEGLNSALAKLSKHVGKTIKDLETMKGEAAEKKASKNKGEDDEEKMEEDDEEGNAVLFAKKTEVDALVLTQKNVFLDVMLKFAVCLSEHARDAKTAGDKVEDLYFEMMMGRLRQVFIQHERSLVQFTTDLEDYIFSNPEVDERVVAVFHEFQSLRA